MRTSTWARRSAALRGLHAPDATTFVLGYLATLFLIPSRLVFPGMGSAGRPAVAIGIFLFVLWVLCRLSPGLSRPSRQPVRWVVLAMLLVSLVGYAVAYSRGVTAEEASSATRRLLVLLSLFGITLVVADGPTTRARLDRLLVGCVWLAGAMAVVGGLQFVTGHDLARKIHIPGLVLNSAIITIGDRGQAGAGRFPRVAGTALHYIEFGVVLGMIIPLALHYALFARSARQRQLRWGLVALIATCTPFAVSRAAMLALLLGLLGMSLIWTRRLRHGALVVGLISIGLFKAAFPGLLGTFKSLFLNAGNDPSVQGRTEDYAVAGDYIRERPWFGRGLGTFLPDQYFFLDNEYLKEILEVGYVGVSALILVLLTGIVLGRVVRKHGPDDEARHLGHALAVSISAGGIAAATFDGLGFGIFAGLLFLLVGASGALWRLTVHEPEPTRQGSRAGVVEPLRWFTRGLPDSVRRPEPASVGAADA